MSILHLVRHPDDERAFQTAAAHAAEHEVTVVLLQDAVYRGALPGVRTVVCEADLSSRQTSSECETVDYDAIVQLIASHDRVISW